VIIIHFKAVILKTTILTKMVIFVTISVCQKYRWLYYEASGPGEI